VGGLPQATSSTFIAEMTLAQSRVLPEDSKQRHKYAEANDNPEQPYRDAALGLSLLVTFSCGCRSV
jgi:hypothetical protein